MLRGLEARRQVWHNLYAHLLGIRYHMQICMTNGILCNYNQWGVINCHTEPIVLADFPINKVLRCSDGQENSSLTHFSWSLLFPIFPRMEPFQGLGCDTPKLGLRSP